MAAIDTFLCVVPRETLPQERRTALVPETAAMLIPLGFKFVVESGIDPSGYYTEESYRKAGVELAPADALPWDDAKVVLRVHPPRPEDVQRLPPGCLHVSFLDPFQNPELVRQLAERGVSAVSLQLLPRVALAQKMDVLSSQANLAGYAGVILAAARLPRILPMMMTPAGTLQPARVLVIGAGVAGLQAIATARRLGARVEAFDTRPEVEEQVRSLGARFVKIDLGETGATAQGYAKELTPEQLQKQREAMAKVCAQSDIVVTTARVFGRKAPVILTRDILAEMKPGSLVVDLAVESGGNVEVNADDPEVVTDGGVTVLRHPCMEGRIAAHASQMFSANLGHFIEHFLDTETKTMRIDPTDEILKHCLLTHDGRIVHEKFKETTKDHGQ